MFAIKKNFFLSLLSLTFIQIFILAYASSNEEQVQQDSPTTVQRPNSKNNFVSNEIILKFKNGTLISEKKKILDELGSAKEFKEQPGVFIINLRERKAVKETLKRVRSDKSIEWAQPNYEFKFSANGIGLMRLTPTEVHTSNTKVLITHNK